MLLAVPCIQFEGIFPSLVLRKCRFTFQMSSSNVAAAATLISGVPKYNDVSFYNVETLGLLWCVLIQLIQRTSSRSPSARLTGLRHRGRRAIFSSN